MNQPVLSVSALTKQVRGRTIVKHVSFDVFPGQIFGFLGPNGAGKTTTIRMLVGLIRPTSGTIHIGGFDLQKHRQKAMQHVGSIVENPDMYPYLTGYENLLQLARMQGSEAINRIDDVVGLVHLSSRIYDRVGTYSLGMRQRLGIAQALLSNPQLLILDEPTNGLDPAGIRELRVFLRQLAQSGMSIFISSHLLAEIELLCDHVAIIREGTVVRTGPIQTLVAEASTRVLWRTEPTRLANDILKRYAQDVTALPSGHISAEMADDDAVAIAVDALLDAGCRLYSVVRHKATLEDVFLETTGGDVPSDFSLSDLQ